MTFKKSQSDSAASEEGHTHETMLRKRFPSTPRHTGPAFTGNGRRDGHRRQVVDDKIKFALLCHKLLQDGNAVSNNDLAAKGRAKEVSVVRLGGTAARGDARRGSPYLVVVALELVHRVAANATQVLDCRVHHILSGRSVSGEGTRKENSRRTDTARAGHKPLVARPTWSSSSMTASAGLSLSSS